MAGCRALSDPEITQVSIRFRTVRDRAIFIVGLRTGLRVSELTGTKKNKKTGELEYVGLRIKDVWQNGKVQDRIYITKNRMKGGCTTRDIPLHPQAKVVIEELILSMGGNPGAEEPLFQWTPGIAMNRFQVHRMLKEAFHRCDFQGKLATHTLRKSYARKIYGALKHDLLGTRDALGHTDVRNTQRYVDPGKDRVDAAILSD